MNPGQNPPPGAPAPNPQQPQGPSFGHGGGTSIKFDAGDMSPSNLIAGITSGTGFPAPRKLSLMMLGLGVVFLVANFVLIFVLRMYYPYLLGLAPIFLLGGGFMLATNEPRAREDGSKAPMWALGGLGVSLVIGLAVGGALCFVVHWGP